MIKISKQIHFSYTKRPKIIAEISGNHGGSKAKFLRLVNLACLNGADLIKIQTYEPKDITTRGKSKHFYIEKGIWKGEHLWDLYNDACTPYKWHKEAFDIAKKHKKEIFSSPFSKRAVDFLEKLKVKLYKIASFEITDLKLINYIASKKKPIIISTGMTNHQEIKRALKEIRKFHNKIILMHCVSSYPTKLEETNLSKITELIKKYKNTLIGLSDHTSDIISSVASVPLGVVAIEKHFKLNDNQQTSDSSFSITPHKLKNLKENTEKIYKSITSIKQNKDKINIRLRRSIFAKKDLKKEQIISEETIHTLRPNIGICASNYFLLLGKKINKKIKKNHPIFFKDIK